MSRRTINLQPEVDGSAVSRIQRAINELGSGDEIIITVESTDAHQADPIIELLDENGFEHQAKGSHDGKKYYINARKKEH